MDSNGFRERSSSYFNQWRDGYLLGMSVLHTVWFLGLLNPLFVVVNGTPNLPVYAGGRFTTNIIVMIIIAAMHSRNSSQRPWNEG